MHMSVEEHGGNVSAFLHQVFAQFGSPLLRSLFCFFGWRTCGVPSWRISCVEMCVSRPCLCARVLYVFSIFASLLKDACFFFFSTLLTLKKWEDSKNGALLFPLSLFFSLSLFRSCGMERIACHRLAFPWCAVSSVGVCVCACVCVWGGGFLSANEFAFLVFPPSSSPIFSAHASRVPFFTQAFPRN